MKSSEYLKIMEFPDEWQAWGMIPEAWLRGAMSSYEPGMERASEHDRNGAFHWWLRSEPSTEQLAVLWKLSLLDPDQIMAEDVRGYIRSSKDYRTEIEHEST